MAEVSPVSLELPTAHVLAEPMPQVSLELRHGTARPIVHDVSDLGCLVGTVPGCDLRLPAANLPPVLCLLVPSAAGVRLRKLAPGQVVQVNKQTVASTDLHDGDHITLGAMELVVHVQPSPDSASPTVTRQGSSATPDPVLPPRQQKDLQRLHQETARCERERLAFEADVK